MVLALGANDVTEIDVSKNIDLDKLVCGVNNINVLDVTNNKKLTYLVCGSNNLSELDISQNILLSTYFSCSNNNLTKLDVSNNPLLTDIHCSFNQIESLDVSNNPELRYVSCRFSDNLESFNIKNGNNYKIDWGFYSLENPKLSCIEVDDSSYSTVNWINIDVHTIFSENCATLSNEEFNQFEFALYPNPTNQKINIDIQQETDYIIYNLSGQQVSNGKLNVGQNKINFSNVKAGIYLLNLKNKTINVTRKIIKL